MLIHLTDGKNSGQLPLHDLDALNWDPHKRECWHLLHTDTHMPSPFAKVFLKRWRGRQSPAHKLLCDAKGKAIRGTPRILGIEQFGTDFVYVFEAKEPYETLDNLLKASQDINALINPQLLAELIDQITECFEALSAYQHIYTDFCIENIMVDRYGRNPVLIDLDSAWSYERLAQENGVPDNSFESDLWWTWATYVVQRGRRQEPAVLQQLMVLSFIGVWGRALALLMNRRPDDAFALVNEPLGTKQAPLWAAIEGDDKKGFEDYFLASANADNLLYDWHETFKILMSGRDEPWGDIRRIGKEVVALTGGRTLPRIANKPPSVSAIPRATVEEGATYSYTGKFTDPDSLSWRATVDYGDGAGVQPLGLSGKGFTLEHVYKKAGPYTISVAVTDNQGATGSTTSSVTVILISPSSVIQPPGPANTAILARVATELLKGMKAGATLGVWPAVKMLRDRRKPY